MVPMIIKIKIKKLKSRGKKVKRTRRGGYRVTLAFC